MTDYGKEIKHVFTHKVWHMNIYYGVIYENPGVENLYTAVQLQTLPISTAHKKALQVFCPDI